MTADWIVMAHVGLTPPPAGWRDDLARRLGQRPRRLGTWAELALYGARQCLDAAGEPTLPKDAVLRVASQAGPRLATRTAVSQCDTGLPMPFAFLQSQPSQMLGALSQHLGWRGDARFLVTPDHASMLHLAQAEAGPAGLLLGWVEEGDAAGQGQQSEWWRLLPNENRAPKLR